jgi:hypothetical protein
MDETRNTNWKKKKNVYRTFVGNPDGKRPLGISSSSSIGLYSTKTLCVNELYKSVAMY